MSSPTVQTPLPIPDRSDASPPRTLSGKEQAEYDRVFSHFSNPDYVLPGVAVDEGALMEEERMWLSYECILRYLRATEHDPSQSIKRLEATLIWRRDFGFYTTITAESVEPEAVTGKEFLYGYDIYGRPTLYLCPSKYCADRIDQLRFLFWIVERAIDFMGPGVESVTLLVSYAGMKQVPSLSLSARIIHILQTHYPERLGVAIAGHAPWIFNAFWKLIYPLLDRVTRAKVVFDPFLDDTGLWRSAAARDRGDEDAQLLLLDQLLSDGWKGSMEFKYTHEVYWPALLSMSETRRKELTHMWRQLGGVVGIKEWDVKVGVRSGRAATMTDGTARVL